MTFIKSTYYKVSLLLLLSLLTITTSSACDICGCANSGSYFGLMPQSNKSLVGVRYSRMHFHTHPENSVLKTAETFRITELYTRFFPINRVQVMAFLPYRFDQQETSALTKRQSGFGDATVLANYNLFNTLMDGSKSSLFTQTLQLGGGVKLPTGKFKYDENDYLQVANPNFQAGSGSLDFIINAFYTVNHNDWGLAVNLSRKFNTTNSAQYKFGNQLYGTMDLYKSFKIKSISITPNIGVYGEYAQHGKQDNVLQTITGGKIVNGTVGINIFANKWTAGVTGQTPIWQKSASGHVFSQERVMVQVGWLF